MQCGLDQIGQHRADRCAGPAGLRQRADLRIGPESRGRYLDGIKLGIHDLARAGQRRGVGDQQMHIDTPPIPRALDDRYRGGRRIHTAHSAVAFCER